MLAAQLTTTQIQTAIILRRADMALSTAEIAEFIDTRQDVVLRGLKGGIPGVVEVDRPVRLNGRPARYWQWKPEKEFGNASSQPSEE